MSLGRRIVTQARRWVGTPYHHQAHCLGRGVDCIGLVYGVSQALDELAAIPVYRDYARRPQHGLLVARLDRHLDRLAGAPAPGDVLLMRFSGEPQHLAVYAGETIVHAYESVGYCAEHRFAAVWRARVVAAYRLRRR